ncbi:morphogenetic protein [Citrobacter sp. wls757]|uniref:morphogenetic protein n=1 Tax=Citrobacter sp. wls757 TaxID=2576417 RepID=UPI0010C9929E|nr:morphogenetic protein [Citrobacter sp. wls757]TKU48589.1 morphogenetic protein [Citrobacter sp. wls757]
MTERGMIFNSEMVRAILDGRKTQTRRPIKFPFKDRNLGCELSGNELAGELSAGNYLNSPFGKPGDRIWVRETFQGPLFDFDQMDAYCKDSTPFEKAQFCVYKADGKPAPEFFDADDNLHCCWRPSIHMPRWASRITLEITDARVERLNAISEEDARAEGIIDGGCLNCGEPEPCACANPEPDATDAFACLWQSIYGQENWNANPWVWVIEFKRIKGADHAIN